MDGSRATTETLGALYPAADEGADAEDLSDMRTVFDALSAAKERKRQAEDEAAELENRIKARLGEAPCGICGEFRVLWTNQTRKSIDTTRLKKERPDVAGAYMRESVSRVLRLTKQKGA